MKFPFSMVPFQETCQFLGGYLNSFWFQQKKLIPTKLNSQNLRHVDLHESWSNQKNGSTKKGGVTLMVLPSKDENYPPVLGSFQGGFFKFHHETWGEMIQFNEERVVDMFVAA